MAENLSPLTQIARPEQMMNQTSAPAQEQSQVNTGQMTNVGSSAYDRWLQSQGQRLVSGYANAYAPGTGGYQPTPYPQAPSVTPGPTPIQPNFVSPGYNPAVPTTPAPVAPTPVRPITPVAPVPTPVRPITPVAPVPTAPVSPATPVSPAPTAPAQPNPAPMPAGHQGALGQTQREQVINIANQTAQIQGVSPEQALWDYAQGQGLSPSQVDALMGFPSGTTGNWASANVRAQGSAPEPQGALSQTQREHVVNLANQTAQQQGISPEQALLNYSIGQGLSASQIDTLMGYPQGTSANWSANNSPVGPPAPQQQAPQPATQELAPEVRNSIIQQAQTIAAQQGISPELALWNYSRSEGLSPGQIDAKMGFPSGTTENWARQNNVGYARGGRISGMAELRGKYNLR